MQLPPILTLFLLPHIVLQKQLMASWFIATSCKRAADNTKHYYAGKYAKHLYEKTVFISCKYGHHRRNDIEK